jgi:hypothetical protein
METAIIKQITDTPAGSPRPFYTKRLYPNGEKLIVSNNPEEVNGQGVLYRDVIKGAWRVFVHHQNKTGAEPGGIPQPIQLLIVIKNPGIETAEIRLERSGAFPHIQPEVAGYRSPTENYMGRSSIMPALVGREHNLLTTLTAIICRIAGGIGFGVRCTRGNILPAGMLLSASLSTIGVTTVYCTRSI